MSDTPTFSSNPGDNPTVLWKRGLWMLFMGLAFHVASMLLCLLAVLQLVLVLLKMGANRQLLSFARSLGAYLRQIAEFVGFASEEIPFPFADWPSVAVPEASDSKPPT
jgi:hypothetical protein